MPPPEQLTLIGDEPRLTLDCLPHHSQPLAARSGRLGTVDRHVQRYESYFLQIEGLEYVQCRAQMTEVNGVEAAPEDADHSTDRPSARGWLLWA
jgi:hypothetical protein